MGSLTPTCRRRATGPRRHHCSEAHADLVESYRLARLAQEARAEAWSAGYATELAAFYRDVERPVTFRDWLTARFPAAATAGGLEQAEPTEDFAA
jgi:hypothetical protein